MDCNEGLGRSELLSLATWKVEGGNKKGSLVPICRGDQLVVKLESELAYAFIAFGVVSRQRVGMRSAGSARSCAQLQAVGRRVSLSERGGESAAMAALGGCAWRMASRGPAATTCR